MKFTSKVRGIPGWIYNIEVSDGYSPDSLLAEGENTINHVSVEVMKARYIKTDGLMIIHCRMGFSIETEDTVEIAGDSVMMGFGLSEEKGHYEINGFRTYGQAMLNFHSLAYMPKYRGRFAVPAGKQHHHILIILSKDFYFNLFNKDSYHHQDFVAKITKGEAAYFSPKFLPVTPHIRSVLVEIASMPFQHHLARLLLEVKIRELLLLQMEQFIDSESKTPTTAGLSEDDQNKLQTAKDILDTDFANPPLLAELAKIVSLNEFKLKVGFKARHKISVYQYVIQQKMRHALHLLKYGKHTVGEISSRVGYQNTSHFSSAFLKYYGYRPRDVAKNRSRK